MVEQLTLSGFKSVRFVSSGPYFDLYAGIRTRTDVHYWIKVLHTNLGEDAVIVEAFENMALLSAELQHPHILAPVAFENIGDHRILLYEAFRGEQLKSLLEAGTPFVERRVNSIIVGTAKAVQFAQMRGIKHGWLATGFIFWSKTDEDVRVLGFGSQPIWERMRQKNMLSTAQMVANIPPENMTSRDHPEPDDAYALGCIYYELLTGTAPFKRVGMEASHREKLTVATPPIKLNPKLSENGSQLAMSLLNPDARKRSSFSTLLDELDYRDVDDEDDFEPTPEFKPTVRQRFRGAFAQFRTGGMVGSRKRVFFTFVIALICLIAISGMFVASRMSARDDEHLQKVYADFIAEAAREEKLFLDPLVDAPLFENVSPQDTSTIILERNEAAPVTINDPTNDALPPQATEPPKAVEVADLRINLIGEHAPSSAGVIVNDHYMGIVGRAKPLFLQELDVSKPYRIRIQAVDCKPWEKSIRLSSIFENSLDVLLEPSVSVRKIHFSEVDFADRIRIDGGMVRNLPSDIELENGVHQLTYVDSKSNFTWSRDLSVNNETPATIYTPASNLGMGEASIVLQDPLKFGYVFARIDAENAQHPTPIKVSLSAGWHRLRLFRQDYKVEPSDTLFFVRPFEKVQIRCRVVN